MRQGILMGGGVVAKWLVHWTQDQAVRVRALAGALGCVLGKTLYSHIVSLSTEVYKWVPENLLLGVTLLWTGIPSRGE